MSDYPEPNSAELASIRAALGAKDNASSADIRAAWLAVGRRAEAAQQAAKPVRPKAPAPQPRDGRWSVRHVLSSTRAGTLAAELEVICRREGLMLAVRGQPNSQGVALTITVNGPLERLDALQPLFMQRLNQR